MQINFSGDPYSVYVKRQFRLPDVLGSRLTCAGDESQMEAVLTALWGPAPGWARPPSYSPRRLGEPNG